MAGQWDDWLRSLKAAGKGPVSSSDGWPSATRGLAWSHPIEIEGDFTGWTLAGTISLTPDAGSPLATFSVTGPVVADGTSTWMLSLASGTGSNSTGGLPGDASVNGEEQFPFMLRLTPPGGTADTLCGGLFSVIGKV